jgi:hypothetical protein
MPNARACAANLVLAGSLLLSGCATLISGPRQAVKVDSVPQGARVFTAVQEGGRQGALLKRKEVGVTPMTVTITRKDGVVELEKEGYQLTRVPMKRGMNPWFIGTLLFGSLVSTSVDTSTGAVNEYDPDEYRVELQRMASATVQRGAAEAEPAAAGVRPAGVQGEETEPPFVPDVRPLSPAEKAK